MKTEGPLTIRGAREGSVASASLPVIIAEQAVGAVGIGLVAHGARREDAGRVELTITRYDDGVVLLLRAV